MIEAPESPTPSGCGLPQHELPRTVPEAVVNLVRASVRVAMVMEQFIQSHPQTPRPDCYYDLIKAAKPFYNSKVVPHG